MVSTSPNSSPTRTVLQVILNGGPSPPEEEVESSSPSTTEQVALLKKNRPGAKFPEYKH
jgi:hypothetical protein